MKRLHILITSIVVMALSLPVFADKATSSFKQGASAEAQNSYDAAYEAYKQAYDLKPRNPKFMAAYTRMRFYAATAHVRTGQSLRENGKLTEAFAEFQRATEIDHSSFIAQQEMRRTADLLKKQARHEELPGTTLQSPLVKMAEEAEGPVELDPMSKTPINLRLTENANQVYKIIGKLAGVNVLFDPDYKPQRIAVELNDVTPRQALDMVALESKTFWQPASNNTIVVAADTPGKRKDFQANVMKTFYLKNVSTPSELQEAANTIRGILDLTRVQLIPTQSAMVLRGTSDQMVLAQKLISDIDKAKAEVVIDVVVMQVSRDRVHKMGVSPPTSANIVMVPGTGGSGTSGGGSGGAFTINQLGNLTANNFLVSVPGATLTSLMSDSNTKIIQNPQIRALDNEKATIKIGDRVPIATGSFGGTGGGYSPVVNTQFQYLDVGVNIDIVPRIHSEGEVTLKMTLEISSVTGQQNIGGVTQPIIGQRRIEHETRLQDGDVNLVGGFLEASESQSLSGYPWLTKIPILKYLFGQEDKERRENEIVFAITPHIIRAQDVTEQNLRMVDVGTGSSVGLRHSEPRATSANKLSSPAKPSVGQSGAAQPKDLKNPPPTRPSPRATPSGQSIPAQPKDPDSTITKLAPALLSSLSSPPQSEDPNDLSPATTSSPDIAEQRNDARPTMISRVSSRSTLLPGNSPAQADHPPSAPTSALGSQAHTCPFGQHAVDYQDGTLYCAFD
jgi:general secretion pathway protein D